MNESERRKLVAELLAGAGRGAAEEAAALNADPAAPLSYVQEHLRRYVLAKYLLPPDCPEDDIRALARLSLERTLRIDANVLRELDQATPCNHATSETTKKILLLYAVQRDLHLPENPAAMVAVQTVTELAAYVCAMRSGGASLL